MPPLRSIQARYTLFLVLFVLVLLVLTVVGIGQLVAPKLQYTEEQVVLNRVAEVAEQIQGELNKVQAQQRTITQRSLCLTAMPSTRSCRAWLTSTAS